MKLTITIYKHASDPDQYGFTFPIAGTVFRSQDFSTVLDAESHAAGSALAVYLGTAEITFEYAPGVY